MRYFIEPVPLIADGVSGQAFQETVHYLDLIIYNLYEAPKIGRQFAAKQQKTRDYLNENMILTGSLRIKNIYYIQEMTEAQYNPAFIYPANLQDCWKHRKANRIFKGNNVQATYDFHKCQCCARSIGEGDIETPLCYDPVKELIFLGPGVPLLFIFARLSTFLLILLTLIFAIFALVTNSRGESCSSNITCQQFKFFVELSIANKISEPKNINIQNYLLVLFIFIYIFFLQFLIFKMRKTDQRSDELINSPSDYALLISQLPQGWTVDEILQMIDQERFDLDEDEQLETDSLSIKDMIFAFKLSNYLDLLEEDQEEFVKSKKDDCDAVYQRMKIEMPRELASFVIVIFNHQASKNVFKQPRSCYYSIKNLLCNCNLCPSLSNYQIQGQPVVVERAPQPDDILWNNADKPRRQIARNKIISFIISIALLVLGGYIQYQLQVQKKSITDTFLINLFSVISSLSLSIFSAILSEFLVFMTDKEGDCTVTHMNSSLLVKVSLFQFFNAGIFNTFAKILADSIDNFDINGDQSYEIFLFMAINAFLPTTLNIIFTLAEFPTGIKRWLFVNGCLHYNQKKGNQIFQKPKIQFPIKYAFIINTIWLACFYGTFVPIVIPVSVLGLIYFYLSEQYLFRNKYSVPYMLSKDLADTAISILRYTGIITLSGSFIVTLFISYKLQAQFTATEAIPYILGLIISLTIIFMPSIVINERLFSIEDKQKQTPKYSQAIKEFTVTYMETHPLSSHARKMKRSQVMVKNFFQLVEMKQTTHHQSQTPVKYSQSMNWVDLDSVRRSREDPLLRRTTSLDT